MIHASINVPKTLIICGAQEDDELGFHFCLQSKSPMASASSACTSHLPVDLQVTRLFHDLLQFLVNLCAVGTRQKVNQCREMQREVSVCNLHCRMRDLTHKWNAFLSTSSTHARHVDSYCTPSRPFRVRSRLFVFFLRLHKVCAHNAALACAAASPRKVFPNL